MADLNAEKLSLREVQDLLGFEMQLDGSFTSLLTLESLSEFEQQEVLQIRDDFAGYLRASKISEGLVKVLTTFPLMRASGFYRFPREIRLEEGIGQITLEEAGIVITGRFDILAVNQTATVNGKPFWLLLIESKNSAIAPISGLPQLLTYAYRSLEYQESVWALATNGLNYQFVYLQRGQPLSFQLMPDLSLLNSIGAMELLQIFKAICKLQRSTLPDLQVA